MKYKDANNLRKTFIGLMNNKSLPINTVGKVCIQDGRNHRYNISLREFAHCNEFQFTVTFSVPITRYFMNDYIYCNSDIKSFKDKILEILTYSDSISIR